MLSTAHACVCIVGALLCFSEWPYAGSEGWISDHTWSHPVTFASIFVGYLQWDWLWCVWHLRSARETAAIVHHSLFILITHYVLYGWYFKLPYAWLSFAELSTPFLNWRWFLAVLGRKDSAAYKYTSLAFALTFLVTRIGGYGLGLAHLWAQRALWAPAATGLYVTIAGVHAGFALNLFWFTQIVQIAIGRPRKQKSDKSAQPPPTQEAATRAKQD